MIHVLVVDDHAIVRLGLVGLLQTTEDMRVVGEAGDGEAAVAFVTARLGTEDMRADGDGGAGDGGALPDGGPLPDVVLMDLRMPVMDGVAATERLRTLAPSVQVLVLTTYDTDANIVRAVEAGARGYLLKDASREELLGAIRSAAAGETVLAPPVASRLVERLRDPHPPLSERERQVLREVAQGLSNQQIGRHLHIGEATVKSHLLRIFGKLGVDDRTRAVVVAMERGEI